MRFIKRELLCTNNDNKNINIIFSRKILILTLIWIISLIKLSNNDGIKSIMLIIG